jgi:hypothetical protein
MLYHYACGSLAGHLHQAQMCSTPVLLSVDVSCTTVLLQAIRSRRRSAVLQQALQQQCGISNALYGARQQLQKQLYLHQQRNAAWAASLQHMQWLVVERAAALATQEALLSKVCVAVCYRVPPRHRYL